MNEKLIVVISEHKVYGWRFYMYLAQDSGYQSFEILGTPSLDSDQTGDKTDEACQIAALISKITDANLAKLYGKGKNAIQFKDTIAEETLKTFVRPAIESCNAEIVELLKNSALPIFLRDNVKSKVMYERDRINLLQSPSKCLFSFIKDEDGLRYHISLTNGQENISLLKKHAIFMSSKPSIVIMNNQLHCIENIDSKVIKPFLEKEFIAVPASAEQVYIKTFILKTIQQYEVTIEGLGYQIQDIHKQAILTLEEDFFGRLVLSLYFEYNNKRINPNLRKHKIVGMDESNELAPIFWLERDSAWEKEVVESLLNQGFSSKENNQFYLLPQDKNSQNRFSIVEWINRHSDFLSNFVVEQNLYTNIYAGDIEITSSVNRKIDWFEMNQEVSIGEYKIAFPKFRKHILEGSCEYVLPNKSIFILPQEWFEKYYELFLHSEDIGNKLRLRKMHQGIVDNLFGEKTDFNKEIVFEYTNKSEHAKPLPSALLNSLLRPYQKEGFYWLENLNTEGLGGCLADDMGLGKTLQTITLLQYIYSKSTNTLPPSLIVVPTSLIHNWKNEILRFAPELKIIIYSGSKRKSLNDIPSIFDAYQIIISSYGIVRTDVELLKKYPFNYLILDESQNIKNSESLAYKAIKKLNCSYRLALTGTPIENSLDDLWAQFNFINEGLLGTYSFFKRNYIQKIVKEQDKKKEEALLKLISPFMLRRTKEAVMPELPPLSEELILCDMSPAQQKCYDVEKNKIRNTLLLLKENGETNKNFIALQGLTRLRQLANHPALIEADYTENSGKFDQIILSFESLKAAGHKVLIFSSFVRHLKLLANRFDQEGWKYAMLSGGTPDREAEIEKFASHDDVQCFFISLKAGGLGLNLTMADYVFLIDPWWNPAAEQQALSRSHRMGQKNNVMAYRFISSETIEEKILKLQEAKKKISDAFVISNIPTNDLKMEEIEALFE